MIDSATFLMVGFNLLMLTVLVFGLFIRRFQRRDIALAMVSLNLSVLAASLLLSRIEVNAGLGLGLFGLLSIVRLRSDEMSFDELAYLLVALILGLIAGLPLQEIWVSAGLMVLIVGAVALVGSTRYFANRQTRNIVLDSAIANDSAAMQKVAPLIDGTITGIRIRRIDMINDSTVVQVRFLATSPTSDLSSASPPDSGASKPAGAVVADLRSSSQPSYR